MSCRESLRRHISYFGTLRLIRGSLGVVLGGGCIGGVSRRAGGVGWRDLLGRVCPKRRRLELRWRGYLQETVRWPGVFVVFSLCFRCASVLRCMMSGLISSVLDTWRTHCAAQTPEQGHPRSGPSWGGHPRVREHRRGRGVAPPMRAPRPITKAGPHRQGRNRR